MVEGAEGTAGMVSAPASVLILVMDDWVLERVRNEWKVCEMSRGEIGEPGMSIGAGGKTGRGRRSGETAGWRTGARF